MESQGLHLELSSYMYSNTITKLLKQTKNPMLKNMITVCRDAKKYLIESNYFSRFSPIWGNQLFIPGRADTVFHVWRTKGLKTIQDLYLPKSNTLMSLQEGKFNIDKKTFFLSICNLEASYRKARIMS